MSRRERVVWWFIIAAAVSLPAWGGERQVVRIAGKAGTMCADGERYEAVRIEGKWKALCYRGVDLEDARNMVMADTSLPSSEGRTGPCMTCPDLQESLELEMWLYYRTRNYRGGWYYGPRRWRGDRP